MLDTNTISSKDLIKTFKEECYNLMRGEIVSKTLDKSQLKEFLDDIVK